MKTTIVHYYIYAEMNTDHGFRPGTMCWLGAEHGPYWSADRAHAYAFPSREFAASYYTNTFYKHGNHARGLYQPKDNTVVVVEHVVEQVITEIHHPLAPVGRTSRRQRRRLT